MGKNKLRKFAEMEQLPNVIQVPFGKLQADGFNLRGHWSAEFFHNSMPITLELGCGRGEYTVGLASQDLAHNFIGIDIKGARMWAGAKHAFLTGVKNAGFLRTNIELIDQFFAPGEVDTIWITFPDPQMKKRRKRLTATNFLELYRKISSPSGIVYLKTDSPFLYEYTRRLVELNRLKVHVNTDDLYNRNDIPGCGDYDIKTHYEQQWLERGKTIKLIAFELGDTPLLEPEEGDIEFDDYRSYGRDYNPKKI